MMIEDHHALAWPVDSSKLDKAQRLVMRQLDFVTGLVKAFWRLNQFAARDEYFFHAHVSKISSPR
jgi:hypothetical protein